MKTANYGKAVKVAAHSFGKGFGAFEASTMLAKMYNKSKEQTLEDLLKVRGKMYKIPFKGFKKR